MHCVMGISRSATIICAYRESLFLYVSLRLMKGRHLIALVIVMATRAWSPAVALMFVRKRDFSRLAFSPAHVTNFFCFQSAQAGPRRIRTSVSGDSSRSSRTAASSRITQAA